MYDTEIDTRTDDEKAVAIEYFRLRDLAIANLEQIISDSNTPAKDRVAATAQLHKFMHH